MDYLTQHLPDIENRLGYFFRDRSHLVLAFVHRSFVNENRSVVRHNERLEFLGDAVLGMLISEYLYLRLPDISEGELSYLRSRLVEADSCVEYIQKLQLEPFILLGRGERMNNGRGRDSILADLFEAIVGAVYLDGGFSAVKEFLFRNFEDRIERILQAPVKNRKALLQDYCQKNFRQTPVYDVLVESGPDHCKAFEVSVRIADRELGKGTGASKKEAQQAAAADALEKFSISNS